MRSLVLSLSVLAACAGNAGIAMPASVANAMDRWDGKVPAEIVVEGGRIRSWTVPMPPIEVDRDAQKVADSLMPGGESLLTAWYAGAVGEGWLFIRRMSETDEREVLVSRDGVVITRGHTVPRSELPTPVLERCDQQAVAWFVQTPEGDRYRVVQGSRFEELDGEGRVLRSGETTDARLGRWRLR